MKKNTFKKLTVTVGIPAYNEEANIGKLLKSILAQTGNFKLKKIIVVSDCSTDDTVTRIKKIKSKLIQVITNKSRQGTALSQNTITKNSTSDVLVILNADVLLVGRKFIDKLINPIRLSKSVGITSPKIVPLNPQTHIERIINLSVEIKNSAIISRNKGNNLYSCHGRARAFSKKLYKRIKWKKVMAEDAFSYLSCISQNLKFVYVSSCAIVYRSPQSLIDHLRQSVRFINSQSEMRYFFKKSFVDKEYTIPRKAFAVQIVKFIFLRPMDILGYAGLLALSKTTSYLSAANPTWSISNTTKRLS